MELELRSRSSGCTCCRLITDEPGIVLVAVPLPPGAGAEAEADGGAGAVQPPEGLLEERTSSASFAESGDFFEGGDSCCCCFVPAPAPAPAADECAERADVIDAMLSRLLPDAERACACV